MGVPPANVGRVKNRCVSCCLRHRGGIDTFALETANSNSGGVMDRREFLKSAATATAAIPFGAFISRVEARGAGRQAAQAAYGPLVAVADETTGLPLLMLPAGFRYLSLGWTGDVMSSGTRTPGAHDGMAAFRAGGRHLGLSGNASELARNGQPDGGERRGHLAVLVRNHEQG